MLGQVFSFENTTKYLPKLTLIALSISFFIFAAVIYFVIVSNPSQFIYTFAFFFLFVFVGQILYMKKYFSHEVIEFPTKLLEPDERILFKLDNVWTLGKMRLFLLSSVKAYKSHFIFTNKRMIMSDTIMGKEVFTGQSSMWYDQNKSTFPLIGFETMKDISYTSGEKPALIVKGKKANLYYKILTNSAKTITERIEPLIVKK